MKGLLWGAVLAAICSSAPSTGFSAPARDSTHRQATTAAAGTGVKARTQSSVEKAAVKKRAAKRVTGNAASGRAKNSRATKHHATKKASSKEKVSLKEKASPKAPVGKQAATKPAAAARASAWVLTGAASAAGAAEPLRVAATSIGDSIGLHRGSDPLALRSAVALVIDAETSEVLYEKNTQYVLPIASLTKVMTAMVVIDGGQPLDEVLTITEADRDRIRHSRSKLPIGSKLTRRELLQLALMSSENRAASALARHYPGGVAGWRTAANRKAKALGMRDSFFDDGTGLSADNVSTAPDLAKMVQAASGYPLVAELSTASEIAVRLPRGSRRFYTTNRLVGSPTWDLDLQKTGYIDEAGNCMVLKASVEDHSLIIVLLDSFGRLSRVGDAERIRRWLNSQDGA